ncbi:unnamed protein product [Arctogadus glacialis]
MSNNRPRPNLTLIRHPTPQQSPTSELQWKAWPDRITAGHRSTPNPGVKPTLSTEEKKTEPAGSSAWHYGSVGKRLAKEL